MEIDFATFMRKHQYLVLGAFFVISVVCIMLAGWLERNEITRTGRKHRAH